MSLLIDPRVGSRELLPYFAPYDIEVIETPLEFGDAVHFGNGPDDEVIWIGYERKVLGDMIASMRDRRFQGHQLPGLLESYRVVVLIVEGLWQCGVGGVIEVPRNGGWRPFAVGKSPMMYRELDHFLATLTMKYGVVVERTANRGQTAALLASRYRWWNDKRWEEHRSCEAIYAPFVATVNGGRGVQRGTFARRTVPKLEKMVAQLDGVDRAAYAVAKEFGCAERLICRNKAGCLNPVGVDEIAAVEVERVGKMGKKKGRLGPAAAEKIWRQLRER